MQLKFQKLIITYKLTHIQKNTKFYMTLLKRFLNNEKIPFIPHLFHGNKYVTGFKKKAELFNSFFGKQCSQLTNSCELPLNLHYTTEKRLDTLNFSNNNIEKIIQNLDLSKPHGHDKISIWIIKIFCKSICKHFQLIFNQCSDTGYRSVSLLPTCGKILKKFIFNEMAFPVKYSVFYLT